MNYCRRASLMKGKIVLIIIFRLVRRLWAIWGRTRWAKTAGSERQFWHWERLTLYKLLSLPLSHSQNIIICSKRRARKPKSRNSSAAWGGCKFSLKNAMVEFDKQVLASFINIFAKNFVSYSEREFAKKNLSGTMICSISLVFSREFKDWYLQWDNEYSATVGQILTIF